MRSADKSHFGPEQLPYPATLAGNSQERLLLAVGVCVDTQTDSLFLRYSDMEDICLFSGEIVLSGRFTQDLAIANHET